MCNHLNDAEYCAIDAIDYIRSLTNRRDEAIRYRSEESGFRSSGVETNGNRIVFASRRWHIIMVFTDHCVT